MKSCKKCNGADDIYLTKNSIAVRRISTYVDKRGKYHLEDKTKYYKKTSKNLECAQKKFGFIRNGR